MSNENMSNFQASNTSLATSDVETTITVKGHLHYYNGVGLPFSKSVTLEVGTGKTIREFLELLACKSRTLQKSYFTHGRVYYSHSDIVPIELPEDEYSRVLLTDLLKIDENLELILDSRDHIAKKFKLYNRWDPVWTIRNCNMKSKL